MVVKPRQAFLDWLHKADPTSHELTLQDVSREPTIYLIPECDTGAEVDEALRERCKEIFVEQLAGWFNDETPGLRIVVWRPSAAGSTSSITRCLVDLCDDPLILEFD